MPPTTPPTMAPSLLDELSPLSLPPPEGGAVAVVGEADEGGEEKGEEVEVEDSGDEEAVTGDTEKGEGGAGERDP